MGLHAALKQWYARPGDQLETRIDGYIIDIVRPGLLIEIQTRNFSALKRKLSRLVENHSVRLVYPIAREKTILRLHTNGQVLGRRKSPRHSGYEQIFSELVRIPSLITHPNFSLDLVLTREEEHWLDDGQGSWRRKHWSITDRRLLEVISQKTFSTPQDFLEFLPAGLPQPFTTRELARNIKKPAYLAQKMVYCLRQMGLLEVVSRRGRAYLYQVIP